jgi:hypothetical protein
MNCREARRYLSLYAGSDLPNEKANRLEQHLSECESCSAELSALRNLRSQLASTTTPGQTSIPSGFVADVIEEVRMGSSQPRISRRVLNRPIALAGAALVAIVAVVVLRSALTHRTEPTGYPAVGAAVSWTELRASIGNCLEQPVTLDQWSPKPEPAVLLIMHTPPHDSTKFVIDYCGAFGLLRSWRGYPWIHSRERTLFRHTGSSKNVYVSACYLKESDPADRRRMESRVIDLYRPYFNTAKGTS